MYERKLQYPNSNSKYPNSGNKILFPTIKFENLFLIVTLNRPINTPWNCYEGCTNL